jgi:hypothetical protein
MNREYRVGQHIVYVDPKGQRREALVTVWWSGDQRVPEYVSESGEPGCNVVIVSDDDQRTDKYGRQIEHETSVVHKSKQVAHGRYWCWADE